MNPGHTCLFQIGFCTLYFGAEEKNAVTLPHSAQRKKCIFARKKVLSKTKKLPSRKKIALELLHQILCHRSTRLLLAGDNANVWEDIELIIDPYPFANHIKFLQ